jgi:hypothetical protein
VQSTVAVTPEDRVAQNNATFREANESIRDTVEREQPSMTTIPFICECAREDCRELVPMSLDAYASVREEPTYFVNFPGHEEVEGAGPVVVERGETFVVVDNRPVAKRT